MIAPETKAPTIGISENSPTTKASANAYSPRPTTNEKTSVLMPAHSATRKAPGDVGAGGADDLVAELADAGAREAGASE